MNELGPFKFQYEFLQSQSVMGATPGQEHQMGRIAMELYERAYLHGRFRRFWRRLTRRHTDLLDLKQVEAMCSIQGRHEIGVQTVSLAQICGSEGRCRDFDRSFYPTQTRSRERWASIATAQLRGQPLPPVSLVQVDDRYFVRDGHHRISVARLLQRDAIEAVVVVWEVAGVRPWARPATTQPPALAIDAPRC
jgi:hypothetical protein